MNTVLLSIHILGAIVFIGPVTVAASLFPRYLQLERSAAADQELRVTFVLHRITRVYGLAGIVVPLAGLMLASSLGVVGDIWVTTSMALTTVAAFLLLLVVYPKQSEAINQGTDADLMALRVSSGIFALCWSVVVVLMIVRPGSSLAS